MSGLAGAFSGHNSKAKNSLHSHRAYLLEPAGEAKSSAFPPGFSTRGVKKVGIAARESNSPRPSISTSNDSFDLMDPLEASSSQLGTPAGLSTAPMGETRGVLCGFTGEGDWTAIVSVAPATSSYR